VERRQNWTGKGGRRGCPGQRLGRTAWIQAAWLAAWLGLDWAFGLILVGPNVVLVGCAVVVSDCDELTFNEPPTFYSRQTYKFLGKLEFAKKKEVY
jgi:hypothetical protein